LCGRFSFKENKGEKKPEFPPALRRRGGDEERKVIERYALNGTKV